MSNDNLGHSDDRDNNLATVHISVVRSLAKSLGITAQRDWKRDDYVRAIKIAQGESLESSVPDNHAANQDDEYAKVQALVADYSAPAPKNGTVKELKPGYARIIIHKDPTPGHANSPIPLGLNGKMFIAPRGVEVDLPLEYIGVLKDAVQTVIRQKTEPSAANPAGEVVEEDILSYPFQVLQVRPGKGFRSDIDQRGTMARRKEAFLNEVGKYPTHGELLEWEKEKRLQLRS